MQPYVGLKADGILTVIQKCIEEKYGYESVKVIGTVQIGCNDPREYEPDIVKFTATAQRELTLGIGTSEINIPLTEEEATALIKERAMAQEVEVTNVEFLKVGSSGYGERGGAMLTGAKIYLNSLEDLERLERNKPKEKTKKRIILRRVINKQ